MALPNRDATPTQEDYTSGKQIPPLTLWTNIITLFGVLLAAFSVLLLMTFWLFVLLSPSQPSQEYILIIGFLVLPSILLMGLILCPVGIAFRKWKYRKFGVGRQIPVRLAIIFLFVSFFFTLPILGISGYYGYHYTESSHFCGSCHSVMDPQHTAYEHSPHARITCAGCHIGPGASPFVKSKLSGTRQVFATILKSYPRPIPPAIHQLRPARDTCEQCHWPDQFFGSQLRRIIRYSLDEANTRHQLEILIKVGGNDKHLGRSEGIHMHMVGNVEYITSDPNLQHIPWIRYHNPDGTCSVFRSDGKSATDPPPDGQLRILDCMDCHNRAGHHFMSPQEAVDQALDARLIDTTLPFIKRHAVSVLEAKYPDKQTALNTIDKTISEFYQGRYPQLWQQRQPAVIQAAKAIQDIYASNIFPYMRVDWATYPDNIGHLNSAGCLRCHDGRHVNEKQLPITSSCSTCHTFLNRSSTENVIIEGEFQHALKIHDLWQGFGPHKHLRCDQCHNGGLGNWGIQLHSSQCGDCHASGRWLEMKGKGSLRPTTATDPS